MTYEKCQQSNPIQFSFICEIVVLHFGSKLIKKMIANHQMQVQIIWQHVLFILQKILYDTQDYIIENNKNLELHNQMMVLFDLYSEARERLSNLVDEAINLGDIDRMLSEVSKAEKELKKFIALAISMQTHV